MPEMDKLTMIPYDKIYLSQAIGIERKNEEVVGPHKTCQVVMARGLFKKWKSPNFYAFDQPMTKAILDDLITKLYVSGYTVVGVTSDLGPSNKAVLKDLDVDLSDPTNCSFPHPCNPDLEKFTFFDAPHLLKLLRNHLLDSGYRIDGKFFDKQILYKILELNSSEISTCFKLHSYHVDVSKSERQKVKLSAQVLSNNVAMNIKFWGHKSKLEGFAWKEAANFIQAANDWYSTIGIILELRMART